MNHVFIRFASFFDTIESIHRIDIRIDNNEESIYIRPSIVISPVIERRFGCSAELFDNAPSLSEACDSLMHRFPRSRMTLVTYRALPGLDKYIKVDEFFTLERVCDPFSEAVSCDTIHDLYRHYCHINEQYTAWKQENSDFSHSWLRNIPPLTPLIRHKIDHTIESVFGDNGTLYQGAFKKRDQQVTLARAIGTSFCESSHLLANAPTGIGKSLAYLVNAAIVTSNPEHRVLISTFSKRLQNQLRDKDVPHTESLLNTPLGITFLKGRTNYICLSRVNDFFNSSTTTVHEYVYSALTAGIREIDALVLSQEEKDSLRPFTCDPQCPYKELCFYRSARERAMKAQICVVNHALLIRERAFGRFAHITHVIIDEAHHIEELIVKELGGELTRDSFRFLDFSPYRQAQEFSRGWRRLFDDIERADHETIELFFHDAANIRAIFTVQDIREQFDATLQIVRRYFYFGDHYYKEPVERHEGRYIKLYPYRIDGWMRQKFWDAFRSVCMLSGTLFVNDGAMRGIVTRTLGVPDHPRAECISLPSPFDYAACTRFFVPSDFPRYDYQEKHVYIDAVAVFLREFIVRTEAKTLVLFTAYEDMMQTAELLADFFKEQSIQLYINSYREDEVEKALFPVIFGTYGMWEGVDIRGHLLHSVIMVKSPFSSPNDGYFKTKQHIMDDGLFYLYYLNHAVMKFRQGFGRLIRSIDDKGIFVLLDNRITSKSYKKFFMSSIAKDLPLSFIPTRDIFNHAESFLFDKTGAFLKDYRSTQDTYRFLDYKQLYIARDGERGIKIIYGGAGTGKTVVLIHRLKFLLMHFAHIERVLFVTFNAALARFIENILSVEGLTTRNKIIDVRYFYELCAQIVPKPEGMKQFSLYYRTVLKNITDDPSLVEPYDAIFVDEGQDFGPIEYAIISRCLNSSSADFMCAIDKNQALYDIDFAHFFKDKPIRYYHVERSYRNTAAIQSIAARFNRSLFVHDDDIFFNNGTTVHYLCIDAVDTLLEAVAEYMIAKISEGYSPGDCAILYPTHALYGKRNIAETLGEILRCRAVRVTTLTLPNKKKTFSLRDNTVKLTTIHSAKGLEFSVVVFLGADTIPINSAGNNLSYVAVTRAREALCCAYRKPVHCAEILKPTESLEIT